MYVCVCELPIIQPNHSSSVGHGFSQRGDVLYKQCSQDNKSPSLYHTCWGTNCSHICWINLTVVSRMQPNMRITPTIETTCPYISKASPSLHQVHKLMHMNKRLRPNKHMQKNHKNATKWWFLQVFMHFCLTNPISLSHLSPYHSRCGFSQVHRTKGGTCCVASKVG